MHALGASCSGSACCCQSAPHAAQIVDTERTFVIHHANAYEEGDDVVVWSSGWGPQGLAALSKGSGMLGSWREVLQGSFDDIPLTSLWQHRCSLR